MQSGESSGNVSDKPPQRFENLVGAAIALFTLLLPLWVIGHYSKTQIEIFPETSYQIESLSK